MSDFKNLLRHKESKIKIWAQYQTKFEYLAKCQAKRKQIKVGRIKEEIIFQMLWYIQILTISMIALD